MSPASIAYRLCWPVLWGISAAAGAIEYGNSFAFEEGPFIGSVGPLLLLIPLLLAPRPKTLIGVALWVSSKMACVIAAAFGPWWPLILGMSPVLHGTLVCVAAVATHLMDEGALPRWPPVATDAT